MRELKFRVWCKRTQEYHTPIDEEDYDADGDNLWLHMCIDTNGRLYYIETSNEGADFEYVTHDCEIIDGKDAKNFIVEQYTGLKDKNGKEIYEGDIVSGHSPYYIEKFEIAWREDRAGWFGFTTDDYTCPLCNIMHLEVIGNIHGNPELLSDTNVTNKEEEWAK